MTTKTRYYGNNENYMKLDYNCILVINEERFLKLVLDNVRQFIESDKLRNNAHIYVKPSENGAPTKYYVLNLVYPGYVPPPDISEDYTPKTREDHEREGCEVFSNYTVESFPDEELKNNPSLHKKLEEDAAQFAYCKLSNQPYLVPIPSYIGNKWSEEMKSMIKELTENSTLRGESLRRSATIEDLAKALNKPDGTPALLHISSQHKEEIIEREQLFLYMPNKSEKEIKEVIHQLQSNLPAKPSNASQSSSVEQKEVRA